MKRLHRTAIMPAAILSSLAFLLILVSTSLILAQQKQETTAQESSSRRDSNSVMLTVTVTDRRRNYVKGLGQTNFTVSDGKQEQQINAFSASDMPLSVGILLDTSMSVGKENLKFTREALKRFFQLSERTNEYFLVGVGTKPKLLQDWTSDTERLLNQMENVSPEGATALFDACAVGVEKVLAGRHRKQAIILVTDGLDSTSKTTYTELKRLLEESGVLLYSIGLLGTVAPDSSLGLEGKGILAELSNVTGGAVFFPDSAKQTNAVFDMLAIELRNQYLIRFTPTLADGNRHSLRVKVAPPADAPPEMKSLTVRSRKSFYARAGQR